jgi:hypothetical protein
MWFSAPRALALSSPYLSATASTCMPSKISAGLRASASKAPIPFLRHQPHRETARLHNVGPHRIRDLLRFVAAAENRATGRSGQSLARELTTVEERRPDALLVGGPASISSLASRWGRRSMAQCFIRSTDYVSPNSHR